MDRKPADGALNFDVTRPRRRRAELDAEFMPQWGLVGERASSGNGLLAAGLEQVDLARVLGRR